MYSNIIVISLYTHSWEVVYSCIPDEQEVIEATLIDLVRLELGGDDL